MNGQTLWFVSRATGVVSLILMTTVFTMGVLLAGGRSVTGKRSVMLHRLHRSLSLGSLVFIGAHIVTAIVDGYVSISWLAVVLPFTSDYATLTVTLGTLVIDLLLTIVGTSLLRHRIPERAWKFVHLLAYAMWPTALLHGVAMSTANQPVLRYLTITCGVVGAVAVLRRVARPHPHQARAQQSLREEWS